MRKYVKQITHRKSGNDLLPIKMCTQFTEMDIGNVLLKGDAGLTTQNEL